MKPVPACLFCVLFLLGILQAQGQNPTPPTIPAGNFNVTTYGAVGDGATTDTTAIQDAINAAIAVNGGTVEIPSGTYLSGALTFGDNINLQLDSGAILQMLPYGTYSGTAAFITFSGLHDVEISGTGTINGGATFSGWWQSPTLSTSARPVLLAFNSCNRVLIQNVTMENPPSMHMTFKGSANGNICINGITISTSGSSPNTDGMDLIGTNCLVENSSISDGDDNIALGSTGGTSSGTLVTNCIFGTGHGCSIGSNTSGGVSNLVVMNCSFNGTEFGIRLKSDNSPSSGGEGGLTQNLLYENLTMTGIQYAPIIIYSYYNEYGTPINITPTTAANIGYSNVVSTTCAWRNIVFSNITASVNSGGIAGILWGRTESPITNVLFTGVTISASQAFDVYNTRGFQFVNSQITAARPFAIYNAGMVISNSTPNAASVEITGLTSSNVVPFGLYNASSLVIVTDLFDMSPITLSSGTLTVSALNFMPPKGDIFNFTLSSNTTTVAVAGSLTFSNATLNITNGPGFGTGTYTLFSYTGSESGVYALGSVPTNNFNYALSNAVGQVEFVVTSAGPSTAPVSMTFTNNAGKMQLSWPLDHTGWILEIQTNNAVTGLGTNWVAVPGSTGTNVVSLPINAQNQNVFLRLVYP